MIIERGRNAAALVNNPTFQAVVDDLTSYHLSALVAAPPGERGKDARDYHHLLQHALTELCGQLAGYVEAGEAAYAAVVEAADEENDV